MLLFVGIWLVVGGYAGTWWGVKTFTGDPHSFAYGVGLSSDASPPGSTVKGTGAAVGGTIGAAQKVLGVTP